MKRSSLDLSPLYKAVAVAVGATGERTGNDGCNAERPKTWIFFVFPGAAMARLFRSLSEVNTCLPGGCSFVFWRHGVISLSTSPGGVQVL